MVVLAQHPELLPQQSKQVDATPRGIRLDVTGVGVDGTAVPNAPGRSFGTQNIQKYIIRSLCESVGSDRVELNSQVVQRVRKAALERGVSHAMLTDKHIVVSLFNQLARTKRPIAVVLSDMQWLVTSQCAEAVLRELADKSSRIVFIAASVDNQLELGQVPPSAALPVPAPPRSDAVDEPTPGEMPPNFATYLRGLTNQQPGAMPSQVQQLGGGLGTPQMSVVPMSFAMTIRDDGHALIVQPGLTSPSPVFQMVHAHAARLRGQSESLPNHATVEQYVQHASLIADPISGAPALIFRVFPANVTAAEIQRRMKEPEFRAYTKSIFEAFVKHISRLHQVSSIGGTVAEMPSEVTPASSIADTIASMVRDKDPVSQKPDAVSKKKRGANKPPKVMFPRIISKPEIPSEKHHKKNKHHIKPNGNESEDSQPVSSQPAADMSTLARRLASEFELITVSPPSDHRVRVRWDRVVDREVCDRIAAANTKILVEELKRSGIGAASGALSELRDVLERQVLSAEEVRSALSNAFKLQAGLHTSSLQRDAVSRSDEILLTHRSLDLAFSAILKTPIPCAGRATSLRSKEQLAALAVDKHEKGLLSNIISPQDIGVTVTYPLKYPQLYSEGIASEAVKGVLLFGPPGTGKTMLAKAVATEGGASFLTIDASVIENKWLGESEKNARAVFTLARRLAPCVIYLDEVDSILSSREGGDDTARGTLTSVKTTLMQEWDGLRTGSDRVIVIASTNRPFDLDEAVLRRLPRRIMVDLPDLATRAEILRVTLKDNRMHSDVNLTALAVQLEGYTGSDIKE
eukprot:gene25302-31742_t